ncbi:MAG: bifunctional demethylmenaquinone methyltransferase/2-methoxy-6-polyprenyl-1,4-benzoquinol methylase UbiE [Bacteroidota bacterium]|nr:bifunctional demethylmenaquinone methyltransferase/2-methoxy-6-polyprenyl-1,4-benzoquinol methylase UbiE [Bacteroidota bacterium]
MKTSIPTQREEKNIQVMFNKIAPTYDLLNRLISFGLDQAWRKKAIALLAVNNESKILDIAAGSGDITLALAKHGPKLIVATDFALRMFNVFRQKLDTGEFSQLITFTACNALDLPFRDQSFDGTIVAFGIRNFADRFLALQEMHRVLKSGGISVILELTEPTNPAIRQLYKFHARLLLPLLGKLISKHKSAYRYLPDSIKNFPNKNDFRTMMNQAGFIQTSTVDLAFGTATIFVGRKQLASE